MKKGKFFLICLACAFIGAPKLSIASDFAKNKTKAAELNVKLGLEYLKQNQLARAKSKLIHAMDLAQDLPQVHYAYGLFLEEVGEYKEAEKAYKRAIRLNPHGGNEHNSYAAFLCRQHQYKAAEKGFLRAIEDPHFNFTSLAYENAGLCVLQIPDVAKATEYFEKALRYDQNRPNALLELAILKFQSKQFNEAKKYHARYTQLAKPTVRSLKLAIELAKYFKER